MMEYKRFVSYLYRYEGGQKERNAGFVRLEVRNSQCRIRIFLHHLPERQTEGEAWMFRQGKERFQMIPLGRLTVREGGVEVCLATRADNFLDTGLSVTDFRGLAVFLGTEERMYLTVWDDEPVDLAAIRRRGREAEEKAEEAEVQEEVPLEAEVSVDEQEQVPVERPAGEEKLPEEREPQSATESLPAEPKPQIVAESEFAETKESAEVREVRQSIEKDFRVWWRQLLEAGAAVVGKYAGWKQMKLETAEFSGEKSERSGKPRIFTQVVQGMPSLAAPEGPQGEFRRQDDDPLRVLAPESLRPETESGGIPPSEVPTPDWAALCRQLPHFLPDGQTPEGQAEEREFLRLSLQDIGRLPRTYWDFGKNAFVLYGFSLRKHLILMREKSSACFLGVPGRDLGEDRLAAEMFGFHRYIELGGQGYWLSGIKL